MPPGRRVKPSESFACASSPTYVSQTFVSCRAKFARARGSFVWVLVSEDDADAELDGVEWLRADGRPGGGGERDDVPLRLSPQYGEGLLIGVDDPVERHLARSKHVQLVDEIALAV